MMRDSSTYYMLGYNSSAPRDGRFHKVTVKVKRPGLEVRARQGYYAGAAVAKNAKDTPPPDPIARLLTAAMPSGGLGLRVNAGVVRIDDARAGQTSRRPSSTSPSKSQARTSASSRAGRCSPTTSN